MGAVLTPQLIGVEKAGNLPNASTFCGRCESVCPVRIPLPKHDAPLARARVRAAPDAARPSRQGLGFWAFFARRPRLYRLATAPRRCACSAMFGRGAGRFRCLPLAGGWTRYRDFPAPQGATFQEHVGGRGAATR